MPAPRSAPQYEHKDATCRGCKWGPICKPCRVERGALAKHAATCEALLQAGAGAGAGGDDDDEDGAKGGRSARPAKRAR